MNAWTISSILLLAIGSLILLMETWNAYQSQGEVSEIVVQVGFGMVIFAVLIPLLKLVMAIIRFRNR